MSVHNNFSTPLTVAILFLVWRRLFRVYSHNSHMSRVKESKAREKMKILHVTSFWREEKYWRKRGKAFTRECEEGRMWFSHFLWNPLPLLSLSNQHAWELSTANLWTSIAPRTIKKVFLDTCQATSLKRPIDFWSHSRKWTIIGVLSKTINMHVIYLSMAIIKQSKEAESIVCLPNYHNLVIVKLTPDSQWVTHKLVSITLCWRLWWWGHCHLVLRKLLEKIVIITSPHHSSLSRKARIVSCDHDCC